MNLCLQMTQHELLTLTSISELHVHTLDMTGIHGLNIPEFSKNSHFIKSLLIYLENDSIFKYSIQAPSLVFMTSLNFSVLYALIVYH